MIRALLRLLAVFVLVVLVIWLVIAAAIVLTTPRRTEGTREP
jgi:hypothetical protein